MTLPLSIEQLRLELGLNQQEFARRIGLGNKGSVSVIERGGPCSLKVALAIERLSAGKIDASTLNPDVAAARASLEQRTHDGASAISDDLSDWQLSDAELASLPAGQAAPAAEPARVIICAVCECRVDGAIPVSCTFIDCPHARREAA